MQDYKAKSIYLFQGVFKRGIFENVKLIKGGHALFVKVAQVWKLGVRLGQSFEERIIPTVI